MPRPRRDVKELLRQVHALRPRDPQRLHALAQRLLKLRAPRRPIVAGHDAPFEYLEHVFFERGPDCVVWANRGGGKTMLGAVATMLDLLFKPGVQVRILGGSMEQSGRMYAYLRRMACSPMLRPLLAQEPTLRRVELVNGSSAQVLSQSQRSVRGTRVHKLRCDEVEEFKPEVWEAAQLVTRSGRCGTVEVRGSVEALSTMHRPFGLMSRITTPGVWGRVFRWSAVDVIERCPPGRDCAACPLWEECQGRAKAAEGFMKIDDLIAQKRRSSRAAWESEMLCLRPRREDTVYPRFDPSRHVTDEPGRGDHVVAGMDFGMRSPLVMLWAFVEGEVLRIVDEHSGTGMTLEQHMALIAGRRWPRPRWIGVDVAGRQRNSHSGLSDIEVLRRQGYVVRSRGSPIHDGVERIRCRLDRGTLLIHRRCAALVEAMSTYHFDPQRPQRQEPVKDGPDHWCDALRYLVVNHEAREGSAATRRSYL